MSLSKQNQSSLYTDPNSYSQDGGKFLSNISDRLPKPSFLTTEASSTRDKSPNPSFRSPATVSKANFVSHIANPKHMKGNILQYDIDRDMLRDIYNKSPVERTAFAKRELREEKLAQHLDFIEDLEKEKALLSVDSKDVKEIDELLGFRREFYEKAKKRQLNVFFGLLITNFENNREYPDKQLLKTFYENYMRSFRSCLPETPHGNRSLETAMLAISEWFTRENSSPTRDPPETRNDSSLFRSIGDTVTGWMSSTRDSLYRDIPTVNDPRYDQERKAVKKIFGDNSVLDYEMSRHVFLSVLNQTERELNQTVPKLLISEDLIFVSRYEYDRYSKDPKFTLNEMALQYTKKEDILLPSTRAFWDKISELEKRYHYNSKESGHSYNGLRDHVTGCQVGAFLGAVFNINSGRTKNLDRETKHLLDSYYYMIDRSRTPDNNSIDPNIYFAEPYASVVHVLRQNTGRDTRFYKLVVRDSSSAMRGSAGSKRSFKNPNEQKLFKITREPKLTSENVYVNVFLRVLSMSDKQLNSEIPKLLSRDDDLFLDNLFPRNDVAKDEFWKDVKLFQFGKYRMSDRDYYDISNKNINNDLEYFYKQSWKLRHDLLQTLERQRYGTLLGVVYALGKRKNVKLSDRVKTELGSYAQTVSDKLHNTVTNPKFHKNLETYILSRSSNLIGGDTWSPKKPTRSNIGRRVRYQNRDINLKTTVKISEEYARKQRERKEDEQIHELFNKTREKLDRNLKQLMDPERFSIASRTMMANIITSSNKEFNQIVPVILGTHISKKYHDAKDAVKKRRSGSEVEIRNLYLGLWKNLDIRLEITNHYKLGVFFGTAIKIYTMILGEGADLQKIKEQNAYKAMYEYIDHLRSNERMGFIIKWVNIITESISQVEQEVKRDYPKKHRY